MGQGIEVLERAKEQAVGGKAMEAVSPYLQMMTSVSQTIESGAKEMQELKFDEREAIYNLKFDVISGGLFKASNRINSDKCGAEVRHLNDPDNPPAPYTLDDGKAPYYVHLKELINDFGTNNENGLDILELTAFSDYTSQVYK